MLTLNDCWRLVKFEDFTLFINQGHLSDETSSTSFFLSKLNEYYWESK